MSLHSRNTMSLPYQREKGSPRTPSYFNSGASSPSGSREHSPVWKSSKKQAFDKRRAFQIIGAAIALFTVIWLFSTLFQRDTVAEENISNEGRINRNHFVDFEGGLDCHMSSTELYVPPLHDTPAARKKFPYCRNRATLLEALNGGGRHGFDEPFWPKGCHYKWYSPKEICMVLERFDGVVFIGDLLIHQIYAAFNILLRADLALGSLETWRMTDRERDSCRCHNQYTKGECSSFFVTSSDAVGEHGSEGAHRAPYMCNRVPHFYLPISGTPAPPQLMKRYQDLLDADPHSWKPVATIHSLGLSTGFQWQQATGSMDEWLTVADNSGRNSPFLWIGPNAAGHLKPPGKIMQEGNNALWHYTQEMGKEAARRGVEHLALYNNTLQAQSWDGSSYGERVSLVQAMMIVNWLALLETT